MLEHVRCKPERHMHSLGRKRKGGGYLERGVKFFPFLLASAGLSWHKTPILTGARNPTSPSFLHRASNTGRTTQLGRASRTAPCISAEPHALEHQGKDTTSPEKKLEAMLGTSLRWSYPGRFILDTELSFCYVLGRACREMAAGQDWLISPKQSVSPRCAYEPRTNKSPCL